MLNKNSLKQLMGKTDISPKNKVLILLAADEANPKKVETLREVGKSSGFSQIRSMNISLILSRHKGLCIRTPEGWELTETGKGQIRNLMGGPVAEMSSSLREQLDKIKHVQPKRFAEEAVNCFEAHLYRAAVVLSWVGAISILYEHVVSSSLSQFNVAANKKVPKWKNAIKTDDLARLKEADFLEILESASIIGKSVKQELQGCLTFRNGCGHPNSLQIGQHRVSAHIESLILNVYSVYS